MISVDRVSLAIVEQRGAQKPGQIGLLVTN